MTRPALINPSHPAHRFFRMRVSLAARPFLVVAFSLASASTSGTAGVSVTTASDMLAVASATALVADKANTGGIAPTRIGGANSGAAGISLQGSIVLLDQF